MKKGNVLTSMTHREEQVVLATTGITPPPAIITLEERNQINFGKKVLDYLNERKNRLPRKRSVKSIADEI